MSHAGFVVYGFLYDSDGIYGKQVDFGTIVVDEKAEALRTRSSALSCICLSRFPGDKLIFIAYI